MSKSLMDGEKKPIDKPAEKSKEKTVEKEKKSGGFPFVVLAIILVLAVIAVYFVPKFTSKSPLATTETFLQAVKHQELATVKTVYAGDEKIFDINTNDVVNPKYDPQSKALITKKLLEFQFTVENEVITQPKEEGGDPTATVDVTMTTINLGEAINQALKSFFATLQLEQMGVGEGDVMKQVEIALLEKVAGAKADYEAKFTLNLTKKEGVWLLDTLERNAPFFNGFYGNANGVMPNL